MQKRYGFGNYERNDVDVRTSTWDLRLDFLKTLVGLKSDSLAKPFSIVRWDRLPSELVQPDKFHTTFCAAFLYLFRGNPLDTPIAPVFLDTPLNHHLALIRRVSDDVSARMAEIEKVRYRISQVDRQKIALNEVLPDWKTVRGIPAAQDLSISMEAWAVEHNLYEDWVLDFLLLALNSLHIAMALPKAPLTEHELRAMDTRTVYYSFTWRVEEALRDAILEFYRHKINTRLWDASLDGLESVPFVFATNNVEWVRRVWHPHITLRSEFIDETTQGFEQYKAALLDLDNYESINLTEFRALLDEYCDEVLKRPGGPLRPFRHSYQGQALSLQTTWDPAKQSRAEFVSESLRKIAANFRRNKRLASKLRVMPKDSLDLALYTYCNRVEKALPKNYSKNPVINTGTRHFRWLVSYQVPPVQTFRAIAGVERAPKPTEAAVKKAITRLSSRIGLPLRPGLKTGRPKGVVEKRSRNRAR